MVIGGVVALVLLVAGAGAALALVLGGGNDDGPPLPSLAIPTAGPTTAGPTAAPPTVGPTDPGATPGPTDPGATPGGTPNTPLITPGPITETPSPTASPGPLVTPTSAPLDSSFCPAIDPNQWGPTGLFGKSFEVRQVFILNTGVELFPGGRVRIVNQLGDAGGYAAFVDADNVARSSFTQWEASKLRYLVVEHGARYFVFEGRQEKLDPEDLTPPPCRVPPSDGQLVAWRAMRYQLAYDYGGWVYYVWTAGGEDMCGTDNIRVAYPAIKQC